MLCLTIKKIQRRSNLSFTAKASGELEEAVAEELEIEDPTVEEAEAVIEELTVEEEVEEEVVAEEAAPEPEPEVSEAPVRHRGPRN